MIILSIDYGEKRTGIAVCDKNEMLASPVSTIEESYAPKLIEIISKLVDDYKAELIVVGKPVNMDGSEGERALKCKDFASLLSKSVNVNCEMFDERMTTVIAQKSLNVTNTRGNKRKSVVDALSAQIILQDFIDFRKK